MAVTPAASASAPSFEAPRSPIVGGAPEAAAAPLLVATIGVGKRSSTAVPTRCPRA
jgi:hypothetical protein